MSAAPAPRQASVQAWLDWQLALHHTPIELGLTRVAGVARALGVLPLAARSVVIAGTNGKGSCAAMIEALLAPHGRTGTYTSPHLWRYNERVRIDAAEVGDTALCEAFAAVEAARGSTSLTYFEFGTLAALWLFVRARVDYAILEVGLGGRLDAVNIVDADVALITQIGLDHTQWLGSDRYTIGYEKAGIMRAGRPAVCADRAMPASIAEHAARLDARLAVIGRDYDIAAGAEAWHWRAGGRCIRTEPFAAVVPENLAAALCVVEYLGLPVEAGDMRRAARARLPGRGETIAAEIPIIYDVAHNSEAIERLVDDMARHPVTRRTHCVLGMLAGKPAAAMAARLAAVVDRFYLAGLDRVSDRGLQASALATALASDAPRYAGPAAALKAARAGARAGDRIVVCGSFLTVAHAYQKP